MAISIPTDFVPADLDATRWENLEPLLDDLQGRQIDSAAGLEQWLIDRGELAAACSEAQANLYISMSCDTGDETKRNAYLSFIETIPPKLKPRSFELDKRQVELSSRIPLPSERYEVLQRDTAAEVELFRDENVPIETELDKLAQEFSQLTGAMTVLFRGEEKTLPQMAVFQESTDRATREEAWRLVAERRLQDAQELDEIYDKMIERRDRIARNAGFDNYVGYAFKSMHRFDYTPADCERFHKACEQVIVPLMRRLDERRRERLGPDTLRPWDLAVDEFGREPLRPFEGGVQLVSRTHAAMKGLDGRLAEMFTRLGDGSSASGSEGGALLDLDTRKGKAPGGYQYMRDRSRRPFIFMNAAGVHRDVTTMVHEAGHAFHSVLSESDPLLHYRHSPIEFAEVASMGMEFLAMPHLGAPGSFYPDQSDFQRACAEQIEKAVTVLPWIATIDAFQHWIYSHPKHTRDDRTPAWLGLDDRFGHAVDWSGLEPFRARAWQRQLHLYSHAFYYIEYGIAQLGALQLWIRSLQEGERAAVDGYVRALSLGGARPLPELFEAAGLEFDFGAEMMKRLADRAEAELAKVGA
jgi:oligoendopeptidase F